MFLLPVQTVSLRYLPPLGKAMRSTIVNRMSRTMPGQPGAVMVQTLPLTTTAISRRGDVTTVQTKAGTVRVDVPAGRGMEKAREAIVKATSGKVSTIVVDVHSVPRGAFTPGVPNVPSLGGFQGVVYPDGPVRVGGSWTYTLDASRLGAGVGGAAVTGRVPMRYRLDAVTTKAGRRVALISLKFDGSLKLNAQGMATPLKIKGGGRIESDVATGVVVATRVTMDTVVPMGKLGSMTQRLDITMTTLTTAAP